MNTILQLSVLALGLFGSVCASERFTVALAHDPAGVNALQKAVYRMSDYQDAQYGQFWTVDQILNVVEPPVIVQMYVLGILTNAGITCENHRDVLFCTGNTRAVNRFFKIDSQRVDYTLPESLKPYVVFVDGISNRDRPSAITPKKNVTTDGTADPGYVGTQGLRRLYNIPRVLLVNTSLASIEYQNQSGFSNPDLLTSQQMNGLLKNPISKNHTIGTDVQPDTETELDVQMESQLAEGGTLWFWGGEQWLYSWAVKFFNTPVVPHVASHSWGWAIDQQCTLNVCNNITNQQYVNRTNVEYLKIAARGITMVTASGDSGAPGRTDEDCGGVNRTVVSVFPGSSPYVLSVGATFVVASSSNNSRSPCGETPLCQKNQCANGTAEAVVNYANVSWTAGGGFGSDVTEPIPPWQEPAVQGYLDQKLPMPTHYNRNKRVYPDISAVGHNCPTWQNGMLSPVDGTSCSSPTMASIVALLNSHQQARGRPRLGLAAPIFYAMYYDRPNVFNDIKTGNNWCTESLCCPTRSDGGSDYGYTAGAGFDPVTGLGTPNVGAMLKWLDEHTGLLSRMEH